MTVDKPGFARSGKSTTKRYLRGEKMGKLASLLCLEIRAIGFGAAIEFSNVCLSLETRWPPLIPRNAQLLDLVLQGSPFYTQPRRSAIGTP